MAITIRDAEQHNDMLEKLGTLTGETTASKKLIKGGYFALDIDKRYKEEKRHREQLQRELDALKWQCRNFFQARDKILDIIK
ncbi:hypothetical protein [Photobacterium indicum]|uniref:hypothetical protein n=1 Tax=Photobacterium indicum TaxID=81447 RepID=UPI003D13372D